ncbi:MAG: formylglycine-generating enzyme family protein [Bacteroidales bacterium]|nr:formylglycine-generating enzyme family protein [Bacteroidales bacterium]
MKKIFMTLLVVLFFISFSSNAQNSKYPEMIFVDGGSFQMGSNNGYDDEAPIHSVTLSDFYIGKYEITVEQYKAFCNATGHPFPAKPQRDWYDEHDNVRDWVWRDNHPIVNVTWNDAITYCQWLSDQTGDEYYLPTEAQWEFAARGGNNSNNYTYAGSNNIRNVAWFDETTYERGTRQVGQLAANELGLYDMSGNAFEWCADYYGPYSNKSVTDPTGPRKGQYRVIRGGSWYYMDEFCKITQRDSPKPTLKKFVYGFRVVKKVN